MKRKWNGCICGTWDKGACVKCGEHYTDQMEMLSDHCKELEEKYHAESNMRVALNLATEQLQTRVSALQSQVDQVKALDSFTVYTECDEMIEVVYAHELEAAIKGER